MKPNENKTQFTLRLPNELDKFLNELAKAKGISKNTIIILKLWELAKE